MISVPFELEYVEFGMPIPGIPLPEKSQKECSLTFKSCGLSLKTKVYLPTDCSGGYST